jgi:hypothetical protein
MQLHFPNLELVVATIRLARNNIKGPSMFGTCNPGAEGNTKVFNVEDASLGKWE